jgi:hypothetical protein
MQDTHDERRIPLDLEPISRRDAAWAKLWGWLSRRERNIHDERVAKAAADNLPLRAAEADRIQRQPGVSQDALDKAARVLARLGKSEGFASVAALPVIGLACVAILYAVAVLS